MIAFSATAAGECRDVPKKALLYEALDTMLATAPGEVSETAIATYARVIRDGHPKKDRAAVELSCALLMQVLSFADRFETDSDLYGGCPIELVHTARAAPAGVYDRESDDYLPIVRVAPVYPARALKKETEGVVVFQFTVDEDGSVVNERVLASSDRMFETAATRAVQKFRYLPRRVDGELVATPGVIIRISFEMDGVDGTYTRQQECT